MGSTIIMQDVLLEVVEEKEFPEWKPMKPSQLVIGSHQEKEEVEKIPVEFDNVLQDKPGLTYVIEHTIYAKSERPIKLTSYHNHYAYIDKSTINVDLKL